MNVFCVKGRSNLFIDCGSPGIIHQVAEHRGHAVAHRGRRQLSEIMLASGRIPAQQRSREDLQHPRSPIHLILVRSTGTAPLIASALWGMFDFVVVG